MKIIDFFGKYIKPIKLKGLKMLNPLQTCNINNELSCIREYDVNIWIYRKGNTIIAFDTGYKNYKNIEKEFNIIGINPDKVNTVFLTHVDIDHAGGIDGNSRNIFPNADVYIGKDEEGYLINKIFRFKLGIIKLKNTIQLNKGYKLLSDNNIIMVDGIKVESICVPGHTIGHMCYIIDNKILITGDCLALNNNGGYCFFDFYNMDSKLNIKSLNKLKNYVKDKNIEIICTGHNGLTYEKSSAFNNIDIIAKSSKNIHFDDSAPNNLFE